MDKKYYSVRDLAKAVGYSRQWLYIQIEAGHIKALKIADIWAIPAKEFNRIVDESKQKERYHFFPRRELTVDKTN